MNKTARSPMPAFARVLVALCVGLVSVAAYADEIRDTSCSVSGGGRVIARYTSDGGSRYIGASVKLKDGNEVDLDVKEIEPGTGLAKWQLGLGEHMTGYRVGLWRTKVSSADCKIRNCPYCKRNGYHLEGSVTGTDWMPCPDEREARKTPPRR